MIGIARVTEKGLLPAAVVTAAIAFLGVIAFDISVMLGLLLTPISLLLSSAALAFVLLRHEEQAAVTTALIAAVMVGFAALVSQQYSVQILLFTLMCWSSSLIVASVLRQTVSLKYAVLVAALTTVLVSLIAGVFKAEILHFWQASMLESVANFTEAELQQLGPEKLDMLRNGMPRMLAETLGSWAFFIVLCSVFVARYWQAKLFNAGGFQQEFHSLRLGKEAVIALGLAIALSLVLSVALFANIASALMFVFFIQGLSVLHCITKQRGMSRSWLTGTYVILMLPPTMLILSVLGMADNLFQLRKI